MGCASSSHHAEPTNLAIGPPAELVASPDACWPIRIPTSVQPGQQLRVTLPTRGAVTLVVPEGAQPGDTVHVALRRLPCIAAVLPEGVVPGQRLSAVGVDGATAIFCAPPSAQPGMRLQIAPPASSQQRLLRICVPDAGLSDGQLTVKTPWEQPNQLSLKLEPSEHPGSSLTIVLVTQLDYSEAAAAAAAEAPTAPAASVEATTAPSSLLDAAASRPPNRTAAATVIQAAARARTARRRRRRLAAEAAAATDKHELAERQERRVAQLEARRAHEADEGERRASLQRMVGAVVQAWRSAHDRDGLRGLLCALDAPELVALLGACAGACAKLPRADANGEAAAAATRRAYLRALKLLHPDKLGAAASLTERVAAAAIFDALRDEHEEEEASGAVGGAWSNQDEWSAAERAAASWVAAGATGGSGADESTERL